MHSPDETEYSGGGDENSSHSDEGNESTNMLYDILVYREWPKTALDNVQSFTTINSNNRLSFAGPNGVVLKEGNSSSSSSAYSWIRSFWPFGWTSPSIGSIPPKIQALLDQRIAWKFR